MKTIAIIGGGDCDANVYAAAEEAGFELARRGYCIICGGLGGVMEAACKGADRAGGTAIGILPGKDTADANKFVHIPVATGMGIARNIIIIRSAHAVLAIDGSFGTLSEIAYAMQLNKPVVGLQTWDISEKIIVVENVNDAVNEITKLVD